MCGLENSSSYCGILNLGTIHHVPVSILRKHTIVPRLRLQACLRAAREPSLGHCVAVHELDLEDERDATAMLGLLRNRLFR